MEKLPSDKYIIFLDVDGTVFDGHEVPKKTSDATVLARERGHKIFINSGRAHCVIPNYILENVSHDGVVGGIAESIDKLVIMNGTQVLNQKSFVSTKDEFFEKYADMRVSKITFRGVLPSDELKVLREMVGNVYVLPDYVEIPATNCNKATAIKRICDYFGAEIHQSIAMGDSDNDFDMIGCAGIGVAMGNANERIKSIADFITSDCSQGGVADALDALIFRKNA